MQRQVATGLLCGHIASAIVATDSLVHSCECQQTTCMNFRDCIVSVMCVVAMLGCIIARVRVHCESNDVIFSKNTSIDLASINNCGYKEFPFNLRSLTLAVLQNVLKPENWLIFSLSTRGPIYKKS